MKVKEMERELINATEFDDFAKLLDNILRSLIKEANDNIKRFCATSKEDVIKQVENVNNKYLDLIDRLNRYRSENLFEDKPVCKGRLDKDGFKAAFVKLNPKYSYILNIESHIQKMGVLNRESNTVNLYKMTPWENLKSVSDLKHEFIMCVKSLGDYINFFENNNMELFRRTSLPLLTRLKMLEYFIEKNNGMKDQTMIDLYENKKYDKIDKLLKERGN